MPIRVLPPALAAQIAAGEVVERPASVVKELLENALDAGATRITIELRGGGVAFLRVTDNGCGIPAAETELALQHHATSKLSSPNDLERIATLGFRGEALPSIAAVSRLTLTTRPPGAEAGFQVEARWGEKVSAGPQGCPPGTSVTVADLFGNLPARRKFLRAAATEAARAQELAEKYALAYPEVRFEMLVEGRSVLAASGNGKAGEVLLAVYGAEVAGGLLPISETDAASGCQVSGFISAPRLNRANRSYLTFFVNRRWTQNRMLAAAVEQAYYGLLPDKRYPLAVLNLALPYDQVDVNCHPSKREARFRQEGLVFAAVQRAARAALVEQSPVPAFRRPGAASPYYPAAGFGAGASGAAGNDNAPTFFPSRFGGALSPPDDTPEPGAAPLTPRQAIPSLRVVGQAQLTYIIAEGPEGVYLVDQHAAHERVTFDRLLRRAAQRAPEAQPLLAPALAELTPSQQDTLRGAAGSLAGYGFVLEPFGDGSALIRAVPPGLTRHDPAQALRDLLDTVAFEGLARHHEDIVAATIACHSSIRAGQALTEAEMRALLEQLEAADNPNTCPHGRPTMIHLSEYHLQREFGRR